jgi:hypothetical protein
MSLNVQHELLVCRTKLFRRKRLCLLAECVKFSQHNVRRLHVIDRGFRISGEEIIGIELGAGDVTLEGRDRDGAWELLTPAPDKIQPATQDSRKGVDVRSFALSSR